MAESRTSRSWLSWFTGDAEEAPAQVEVGDFGTSPEERLVDEGEIGRGGMASVRKVFDRSLKRHLAMKVLDPDLTANPKEVRRFLNEAQITAQLEHPGIPAVHEIGKLRGTYFFTMTLLSGVPLDRALGSTDYSPANADHLHRALDLLKQTCEAVEFAHARKVVHGDLKPGNLLVGSRGHVSVMDWGLARIAGSGQAPPSLEGLTGPSGPVVGSVGYMSPEQARNEAAAIDERTDVFALGGILYCMLTRRPPYSGDTPERLLELAKEGDVVPPALSGTELPARLVQVTMKALAAQPGRRYASARELSTALREAQAGFGSFPVRRFKAGELLFREGDAPEGVFVLVDGRCRVIKGANGTAQVLRQLSPGAIFGESSAFTGRVRTASIEALTPVSVVVVSRAALDAEVGRVSWLGPIIRSLAQRFRQSDERVQLASAADRQARLALALLLEVLFVNRGPGLAEVPYSSVGPRLAHRLGVGLPDLAEALGQLDFVTVDIERDRLLLRGPPRS